MAARHEGSMDGRSHFPGETCSTKAMFMLFGPGQTLHSVSKVSFLVTGRMATVVTDLHHLVSNKTLSTARELLPFYDDPG